MEVFGEQDEKQVCAGVVLHNNGMERKKRSLGLGVPSRSFTCSGYSGQILFMIVLRGGACLLGAPHSDGGLEL